MRTSTEFWATGSCVDIQSQIKQYESLGWCVRQIALTQDEQRMGVEPEFTGFVVYEKGE